jgi:DNA-binding response OmpR family regulator
MSMTEQRAIRRILIVEDEPIIAMAVEDYLVDGDYAVAGLAVDHDDTLERVEAEHPDLVLLDVTLARGTSGWDVARDLKARGGPPVLFVTSLCPDDRGEGLGVGCFAKPFTQATLLGAVAAVDAILNGNRPGASPRGLHLYTR